uniref:General transcription factor II-I repeat domain-containing protein 2B n=4 Tax=Cacopsylla melanoneura TaxID=428564 RepID=A0A8D8QSN0_9HEMI
MVGKNCGFVTLCKKDESFPKFRSYHCIIHQEALCSKIPNFNHVIEKVTKIINTIRSAPMQHRLFKSLLEEDECEFTDLLLHAEVRWLSKSRMLEQFINLIDQIKKFLVEKSVLMDVLNDPCWLADLGFITDVMLKLQSLNLGLQGLNKEIMDMISLVNAFKTKLKLFISHLEKKSFSHFPNFQKFMNDDTKDNIDKYIAYFNDLYEQFSKRFDEFGDIEANIMFLSNPFASKEDIVSVANSLSKICSQVDSTSLEMEIIEIKNNIPLKIAFEQNGTEFWKLVEVAKFPNLKYLALNLKSHFGSTYLCESLFSTMKIVKSKYRSRLTDCNLNDCIRTALSKYVPDFQKLAKDIQCHLGPG